MEPFTPASLRSLNEREVGLWPNFDEPPKSEFLPDPAETYKRHISVPFSIRIPNFIGIRLIKRAVGLGQSTPHKSGTNGQPEMFSTISLRKIGGKYAVTDNRFIYLDLS